jgi:inner membrane protein
LQLAGGVPALIIGADKIGSNERRAVYPTNTGRAVVRRHWIQLNSAAGWLAQRRWPRMLLVFGVLAADLVIWRASIPQLVLGTADEICHLVTAAVIVSAWPAFVGEPRRIRLPAALAASVLLDLDHVPKDLFGVDLLTAGTNRPYGHSALAIIVCCALAVALRRSASASSLAWGTALGIALHLVRDLATGGVPLGWPAASAAVSYPYPLYVLLLLVAAAWLTRQPSRAGATESQPGRD